MAFSPGLPAHFSLAHSLSFLLSVSFSLLLIIIFSVYITCHFIAVMCLGDGESKLCQMQQHCIKYKSQTSHSLLEGVSQLYMLHLSRVQLC